MHICLQTDDNDNKNKTWRNTMFRLAGGMNFFIPLQNMILEWTATKIFWFLLR